MPKSVFFEFRKIENLIHRILMQKYRCVSQSPTHLQLCVLGFLHENADKALYQRDIEKEFCIRRSTATQIVSNLEKQGLIVRENVASDARLKQLVLTKKSAQFSDIVEKDLHDFEEEALKNITNEELAHFSLILEKMMQNLESLSQTNSTNKEKGGIL